VILVLATLAFGILILWLLAANAGILGALGSLLLIPLLMGVAAAARDRLDRRRGDTAGDPSAHFDANRPAIANFTDASNIGEWSTAYADGPTSDSTPDGVSVEERDPAP